MSADTAGETGPRSVLVMPARVGLADVPGLCARLSALYGGGARSVVCDLGAVERADLAVVEALARLRLTARRAGREVRVVNAGSGIRELLALTGLGSLAEPPGAS
ncbi:STAS domain-containing protein [Streptomyces sp. NPDC000594]|uniref:STAS domain-containing protein n=1 Tax=Streptomyces sp. NPDC000594 TaxID=3154261 RepID=UPI0033283E73